MKRLDVTDLPRDPGRVLGALRSALCASFNYTRNYPVKLAKLKEVLEAVLAHINKEAAPAVKTKKQTNKEGK